MSTSSLFLLQQNAEESSVMAPDQLLQQNSDLIRKYQNLLEEHQTLQKQFESACQETSKIQDVLQSIQTLEKDNSSLKSSNDELNQRISILIQAKAELKQKLDETIMCSKTLQKSEIINLQKKLEEEGLDSNRKLTEIQNSSQLLKNKNEELSIQNQKLTLSLTKVFEACSQRFSSNVTDVETAVALLLTSFDSEIKEMQPIEITKTTSMTQTCDEEMEKEKKHAALKSKVKKLKSTISTLKEQQFTNSNELKKKYENVISNLNLTVDQLKTDLFHQNERIEKLLQEKKEILQENAKLNAQIEFTNNQNSFHKRQLLNRQNGLNSSTEIDPAIVTLPQDEYSQLVSTNEKLRTQVSALISKVNLLEDDKNRFKFQFKNQKSSIVELNAEILRLNEDRKELSENFTEIEKKFTDSQQKNKSATILNQQQTELINQKLAEIERLKLALTKDQNTMTQQFQEIESLQKDRNKLISVIQRFKIFLSQFERYEVEKEQKKEINHKFENLNSTTFLIENDRSVKLPLSSFECHEFPDDLADLVTSLAQKVSLRDAAKVKQILRTICNYYNERIGELSNRNEEERLKYIKSEKQMNTLTEFLRSLFPQLDLDFENGYKSILQNHIEDIERQFQEQQQNSVPQTTDKPVTNSNPLLEQPCEIDKETKRLLRILDSDTLKQAQKKVVEIQTNLAKYVKKYKQEKSKRKEISKDAKECHSRLAEELESTKVMVNEMEQNQSTMEIQKEDEKNALISQIEKMNSDNFKLKDDVQKLEIIKNEYQSELKEKAHIIESTQLQLKTSNKELKNSIQAVEMLQKQLRKKEVELNELRTTLKITTRQSVEKVKNERELLQSRYEQIIEPLKTKNLEFQSAVNDLNDTISALEGDNMKLRSEISEMTVDNDKLVMIAEAARNEMERDKQLNETRTRAKIASIEVDYQNKIDELKWKIEQTKKDLMEFVLLQFCELYDLQEKINENNFEKFLRGVKSSLEKLTKQEHNLRRLLALGPNQSIENAVSKLLLESRPKDIEYQEI